MPFDNFDNPSNIIEIFIVNTEVEIIDDKFIDGFLVVTLFKKTGMCLIDNILILGIVS